MLSAFFGDEFAAVASTFTVGCVADEDTVIVVVRVAAGAVVTMIVGGEIAGCESVAGASTVGIPLSDAAVETGAGAAAGDGVAFAGVTASTRGGTAVSRRAEETTGGADGTGRAGGLTAIGGGTATGSIFALTDEGLRMATGSCSANALAA